MRWAGSLPGKRFNVMCSAHFHVSFFVQWNDIELIGNGCFVSDDGWVTENLGMSSSVDQVCFGIHPKRGITFRYKIDLDQ